ncbi:extracellular tyrosine-protein kinase PKDCC-like [Sinocyclocheilus rhinocerous]|uniref:extracellular tyrosine-protein kinase PKDCC-like n=1 Tax=Sinocyclocheilus rhinocerous TaxID=307959 RepID=UPI0007B9F051|nr:PREDICTED: extracellular tyrosine-protein kinase PKDCC-like [Sinocyclocheilus rhinocerous]
MIFSRNPFCAFLFFALLFLSLTVILKKWHFGLQENKPFGDAARTDGLTTASDRLLQQLQERQQELELLRITFNIVQGFMDSSLSTEDSAKYINGKLSLDNPVTAKTDIGCEELSGIKAVDFLGSGYTKTVLKAALPQGLFVALKSVNHQGTDMRLCMEDFQDSQGCLELVSFKLRKEIVLLQRLQHPNIVELKGQCQDSTLVGGITAVLEQGMPLQMIQLLQSPWEERFRVCLGLVRLLQYLSRSPLGSVALLDFQPRQFVMVSGELKLTDLDDASIQEPACQEDSDCQLQFPLRNFTLRCSSSRICEGLNEMRNLYNAYRYFFTYLLPHQAPPLLKPLIHQIMNSTGDMKQSMNKTLVAFEEVLHMYKSGLHLENLPPSITRDYAVLKGMRSVADMEYRCWPSYNQQGCVLSVHSAREAALICSSHPQCTSFSLSSEKTWTGRLLASFRSGFSHLVPDVNSAVYMRRVKASGAVL